MCLKVFAKVFAICALCLSMNFWLGNNARAAAVADNIAFPYAIHKVDHTVIDETDNNGFHVYINITNTTIQLPPFCDLPVSWTLEWQILKSDHSVYTGGVREGIFYSTVASHREDFSTSALKYGYLRYRLTMNAHGDVKTTGWQEFWASPDHEGSGGGGGGQHRSRKV